MKVPPASDIVVLGAGGHAAVLLDALAAAGYPPPRAILDADRRRWGQTLLGAPIHGDDSLLPHLRAAGVRRFIVGVAGIGDMAPRGALFQVGLAAGLLPMVVCHPSAVAAPSARLGAGVQLLAGAIVNARATIGDNSIVNSAAVVEHDCRLGNHVHVAPRACLLGRVSVGDQTHIGAASVVKQDIVIGAQSLIGAGAVVLRDVPHGVVVVGNPARILREHRPHFATEGAA